MKTRTAFATILILVGAAGVHAQEIAERAQADTTDAALQGEALAARIQFPDAPHSSSKFTTEFTALVPIAGAAYGNPDIGIAFGPELGWIHSIGSRSGLGASVYAIVSLNNQAGVKLKYRRRLSRKFSLDAGLGRCLANGYESQSNHYVGSLGLSWNDRLHLVLHYDNYKMTLGGYAISNGVVQRIDDTHRESALYAGLKLGREAGVISNSALTAAAVVFLIALGSAG